MNILSLTNISKFFKNQESTYQVLKNVNLDVQNDQIISIVGVSGSGKTTLLNIIAGLETVEEGNLYIKENLKINYVTQYSHFIEELTILENLIFSALHDEQTETKIHEYCKKFECEYVLSKKPSLLSGGEKQRINIIRALLNNPNLVILDEPTASLDHDNKFKVLDTLLALQKEKSVSLIVVTHDHEVIRYLPPHSHYLLNKKTLIKQDNL